MKAPEHYRGREQTYLKHFFLEKYLERVAYKVGSFAKEFVYVDGFSGPWRTEDPNFEDSSFIIAIKKLREVREGLRASGRTPKIRCIFVEPDRSAFPLLQRATAAVADIEIETINSEFETAIPDILKSLRRAFSLVFIDPTGWTGFGLHQIAPILRHQPGEVLVNFMFDHVNRFLDAPEPETTFDDLFGGPGWKPVIRASPKREDAIIRFYIQQMRAAGRFTYTTYTRIKKPLSERSYFYLVYGTRHPEGLSEFRKVEQREVAEQERIRLDAQQLARVRKSGQSELFGIDASTDVGIASFEAERRENLAGASEALMSLFAGGVQIDYDVARMAMLEFPLVWETDVQRIVKERTEVQGLKPRERVPKPGHRLKLRSSG